MTPEKKQVVKAITITVGIALIIAAIVIVVVVRRKKAQEEEPMDYEPHYSPAKSGGSSSTSSRYTKQEVEHMQSYLFNMGAMAQNEYIVRRIRETGGIDGLIGDGFNDALKEAIKIGLVSSLNDLYERSKKFANA